MIDKAKRFQKSQKSEDIYYPDETYDDPLSDDLLLDLDETHKQVIKQNGQVFIGVFEINYTFESKSLALLVNFWQ